MHRIVMLLFACLLPLIFVGGLLFHVRNAVPTSVDLYLTVIEAPLSHVLLAAVAVGVAAGWLAGLYTILSLKRRLRRFERERRREVTALGTFVADDGR